MEDDVTSSPPSSPSLTAYSCDEGGSDLERYCSASSLLATSSIASSFSHHQTDFLDDSFLSRRTAQGSNREDQNNNPHSDDDDDDDESILGDSAEHDAALHALNVSIQVQKENRDQVKNHRESSILMDSSVAFGSDDWDDFMLDREGESAPIYLFEMDKESSSNCNNGNLNQEEMKLSNLKEKEGSLDCNNGDINQKMKLSDLKGKEPIFSKIDSIPEKLVGQVTQISTNYNNGEVKLLDLKGKEPIFPQIDPKNEKLFSEGTQISTNYEDINKKEGLNVNSVNELGVLQPLGSKFKGKETEIEKNDLNFTNDDTNMGFEMELKGNRVSVDLMLDEANNSFDEMVHEMEQILLNSDSNSNPKNNTNPKNTNPKSYFRDGSSTASTSGTDDPYQQTGTKKPPKNIDFIEVIGAKQKKGDVSFGERLVGVKEYTVYIIKIKNNNDSWQIERRYRDFYALYKELKSFFILNGLILPPCWLNVERESKKVFGNSSPSVISERSLLLNECLRSILNKNYAFGIPEPLINFLVPEKSKYTNTPSDDSPEIMVSNSDSFGKKISLIVEIKAPKSIRQLLESQNYKCAGCYMQLDRESTVFEELVRKVGWSKNSRVCEYTGQLFCTTCHINDTAVLPGRVLHKWDFVLYPVSQFAKSYLDSIYDQPMLCVSAVNPFLFSKVPALLHIMSLRKKISCMLPYITCPFKKSIEKGLGTRRYLLECNDFFALRDLVDLSKGAFSGLPVMVSTIYKRILEHITQQCLVCYDSGVPCAARQSCDDPFSLIFPFQEAEAEKCSSCGSIYHAHCFAKLNGCNCNKATNNNRLTNGPSISDRLTTGPSVSNSNISTGFFSDMISKARPDKLFKPKNKSPIILMGSLPGGDSR